MDLFNVFNTSNILTYASGNVSQANSTAPASIIPPRVLRFGVESVLLASAGIQRLCKATPKRPSLDEIASTSLRFGSHSRSDMEY